MRRAVLVTLLAFGGVSQLSAQPDVLTTLGTTLDQAQNSIFMTAITGVASLTGERSVFTTASGDARAGMVRAMVAVARTFAASEEFARRYALYREAQKPQRSQAARTGGEAMIQQQQAMELAIREAIANAAQLPADARKQLEESIADMRKQVGELHADPEYRAAVDEMAAASARQDDAEFARKLAAFDAEFPENVEALLARRLRHFLLTCGEIDFDAQLQTGTDQIQRFVNPAYESRSTEWKMCFRAGQPAVDAARAAANEWLKMLTP